MPKPLSLATRLKDQLKAIEKDILELLDVSTSRIGEAEQSNAGGVPCMAIRPPAWGPTDDNQKRLQINIKQTYTRWFELFRLLFRNAPQSTRMQIGVVNAFITSWVDKRNDAYVYQIQSTREANKELFSHQVKTFYDHLRVIANPGMTYITLVPDTNALIRQPEIQRYSQVLGEVEYTVVILPTVLSELDKLKVKSNRPDLREKVESVICRLKGYRRQGSLLEGVKVHETVTVRTVAVEPNFKETLSWLDPNNNDDRIIASIIELQIAYPSACVGLITSDINLQNKADMASLWYSEPPADA